MKGKEEEKQREEGVEKEGKERERKELAREGREEYDKGRLGVGGERKK